LTARATDNGGLMATSAPVNITLVTPALLRVVNVAYSPLNVFSFDYNHHTRLALCGSTERNIFAAGLGFAGNQRARARSYTSAASSAPTVAAAGEGYYGCLSIRKQTLSTTRAKRKPFFPAKSRAG